MSARRDDDELIKAVRKIPVEKRRQQLDELLERLEREDQNSRVWQETASITELKPKRRIIELRGLGKEVWRGGEAQDYVNAERESWSD